MNIITPERTLLNKLDSLCLPAYKPCCAVTCITGMVAVLLLSSCSSPTKYPPRSPVIAAEPSVPSSLSASSASQQKAENAYSDPNISVCGAVYRVKSGDSLSEIALHCQVSMRVLATLNQISPPYVIYKNQRLKIPAQALSQSSARATVSSASDLREVKTSAVTTVAVQQEKKLQKPVKHQLWQWPVHKSLPYRFIRDDAGLSIIDIYGVAGQDVYAVASGSVVYAGDGIVDFGNMLVIKHDDEYMSVYAHNSALLVKEGDRVRVGQHIADLGATGSASQPKLYLEARFQGRKIDIKKVLIPPTP